MDSGSTPFFGLDVFQALSDSRGTYMHSFQEVVILARAMYTLGNIKLNILINTIVVM